MNKAVFFVLSVLLAFLGISSVWDNDIWSHLKTGEWILAHHAVPSRDIFSYTASGQPWIATSWLSQVVFFTVYHWTGIPGLILFKVLIIIAAFMLLYAGLLRRGTDGTIAAVVVFLTAVLSRVRFVERPHIFSFLFLSSCLYLLNHPDRRRRWLIIPIQLLWANMHGENVLGIMLCVVYVGHEMWESRRGFSRSIIFLIAVAAVSFVNPISWRAPFFGLISLNNSDVRFFKYIVELRPTTFAQAFRPFWLYAGAVVALVAFDRKRRAPEVLTGAILLFLAARVTRFVPEFLIISAPAAASGLTHLVETMIDPHIRARWTNNTILVRASSAAIFIVMAFVTAQVIDRQEPRMRPGLGVMKDALPVGAARFIARYRLKGRMFNTMGHGGYLLWRLYPQQKVFIDGRIDVFGPELLEREVNAYQPRVWKGLMDQYHFDFAVLDNGGIFGAYPARVLDEDNNWALVYFDDVNLIYARKDGVDAAFAKARAYYELKPDAPDLSYLDSVWDRKLLRNELVRALQEAPSLTAAVMLARVETKDGDFGDALKVLEGAVNDHPRVAGAHVLLARAMMRVNDLTLARREFQKAIGLDGRDVEAMTGLGDIGMISGNIRQAAQWYSRAQAMLPGDAMLTMKLQQAYAHLK